MKTLSKSLRLFLLIVTAIFIITAAIRYAPAAQETSYEAEDRLFEAKPSILPFDLGDVRLLNGPFKHAMYLDHEYLLKLEPDRFLARFRKEAGLTPKAEGYGGWENDTITGHSLGHYLSACALMYKATGDKKLLDRVNYIVMELAECQEAIGTGYLAAFPRGGEVFDELKQGDIRPENFELNGIWVPLYTLHKEMAGLRDAYRLCGNAKALEVERRLADYLDSIFSALSHVQMQEVMKCEHGGINEVLADLYADTSDLRYLKLSRRFHHEAVLTPLSQHRDIMPGKHGNTNIPKLIGLARRYEIDGDPAERTAAEFFWDRIVHHHSYVTGGHGLNEYLGQPDMLNDRLSPDTTETCNVYNMLKLTRHIFTWKGNADAADFYERALYNHILASQNPANGTVVYNLSLAIGWHKEFQDPFNDFTCCVGTGMENHARYGEAIYFHEKNILYINLFIASELNWKEKGFILRQETDFPDEQKSILTVHTAKPAALTLRIRHPHWARQGFAIRVNGQAHPSPYGPSSFVDIQRTWHDGDIVEIDLPLHLRLESMPDNPNRIAVFAGPILLAGDLGPLADKAGDMTDYVTVLVSGNQPPGQWLKPVPDKSLVFSTKGVGRPREVELKPFFRLYDRQYTIYWDMLTETAWKEKIAEHKATVEQQHKIEQLTIDFCQPGDPEQEKNHNMKADKHTRPEKLFGRTSRVAFYGSEFSYDMKILPDNTIAIVATYWGYQARPCTFDIIVDGTPVARQILKNDKPGQFFDIIYKIPQTLTKDKTKITIVFKANPDSRTGALFGLRTIRDE